MALQINCWFVCVGSFSVLGRFFVKCQPLYSEKLPFRTLVIWSFKAEWLTKLIFTERWQGDKSLILGTSGYIYSYNYAGGYHLANQDYTNCIRTEQGRMLESLFDTTLIGLHCWTFLGIHHIQFYGQRCVPAENADLQYSAI